MTAEGVECGGSTGSTGSTGSDGSTGSTGSNNNTDTQQAGSQPVQQGEAKEELAETGAAETSFLIIGAATMIAGGIGFRFLPRLVAGGRGAAA
ncbi:LPXTG cell wall anchor domain-containing protein [Streptomyces filamentosus]|uniref:LPXTG cell wall anchor domain-containing protein n=1 Tax=Streptomyces filamentosus TaxID=67294 RepID=UPI003406AD86